jgi:hypothetical protein
VLLGMKFCEINIREFYLKLNRRNVSDSFRMLMGSNGNARFSPMLLGAVLSVTLYLH